MDIPIKPQLPCQYSFSFAFDLPLLGVIFLNPTPKHYIIKDCLKPCQVIESMLSAELEDNAALAWSQVTHMAYLECQ